MSSTNPSVGPNELRLTRTYDAPRSRVFRAFTDPQHLAQWWGPHGFTTPTCRIDARPGGELYLEMRGPDGTPWETPYPMYGEFVEVAEPEKIVFRAILKNSDGSIFLENLNTVTLTEANGKNDARPSCSRYHRRRRFRRSALRHGRGLVAEPRTPGRARPKPVSFSWIN